MAFDAQQSQQYEGGKGGEGGETAALELFALPTAAQGLPRVFGSPRRYVQAPGVIGQTGSYLRKLGFDSCAVLLSARSQQAEGAVLLQSLEDAGISATILTFGGECSFAEINAHTDALLASDAAPATVIALGGGKVVDAGKSIAHRLRVPSVVVPSLASNDAPCSAASVIYTPEGVTEAFEVFTENPALVLMDTAVVAAAPARYLIAGMGDAMATWYEARACSKNPAAVTAFGARPTLAGAAIAQLCAETVYRDGEAALAALASGSIDEALERIVEANTLLSGIGFECGGLAASHGFAQAYTVLDHVHKQFLHGEMVAMGVLAQLALENWHDEARRATAFFVNVGLPVHLGQLALSADDAVSIDAVVEAALAFPFMANMPMEVSAEKLRAAIVAADRLGREVTEELGDAAYAQIHRSS
ncbi:glycerol dehydrogenase [Congregibacter litoralis]|uniref:Glycerol dehydrogenase n=1 Tax=Congregibacter litoralis KT71 TaxID=314285 RepID=A4A4Z8_9GAMM|nr:glycerol dehydrogenase [Congregibacter litoralis]EAQ98869.1 glycerol 2-dehydrogenase (NAD+) [Congregibacter litoralis KT71]